MVSVEMAIFGMRRRIFLTSFIKCFLVYCRFIRFNTLSSPDWTGKFRYLGNFSHFAIALIRSSEKSLGWAEVKRIQKFPGILLTARRRLANVTQPFFIFGFLPDLVLPSQAVFSTKPYELTFWPKSQISFAPFLTDFSVSARISLVGREYSRPRANGTTQ